VEGVDFSELTTVEDAEIVDMVSTWLIVDDRFGEGKPLKEVKSKDIAFLGAGLEPRPGKGVGGRSFCTLAVLEILIVSLSFSFSSRCLPIIHHIPEGLVCTLISSVFSASISPTNHTGNDLAPCQTW
jgi:hypothetical protein